MARTTVNIDDVILRDLRKLQKIEGKSLGRLVSDLLAGSLGEQHTRKRASRGFQWFSQPMKPTVDLRDKEALMQILEEPQGPESRS